MLERWNRVVEAAGKLANALGVGLPEDLARVQGDYFTQARKREQALVGLLDAARERIEAANAVAAEPAEPSPADKPSQRRGRKCAP